MQCTQCFMCPCNSLSAELADHTQSKYTLDSMLSRGSKASTLSAGPAAGKSALLGLMQMACSIHCSECRKGMWEKAARAVKEPSLTVSMVLVGARFRATTVAFFLPPCEESKEQNKSRN